MWTRMSKAMLSGAALAASLGFAVSAASAESDVPDELPGASGFELPANAQDAPVPWYERFTYDGGQARLSPEQRFNGFSGGATLWRPTNRIGLSLSMTSQEDNDFTGFQIDGMAASAQYNVTPNIFFSGTIEVPTINAEDFRIDGVTFGSAPGEEAEIKFESAIRF